jgi:hypothetical protein
MSILGAGLTRQNRTVVLHLGTTLADYQALLATRDGIPIVIRRVEVADSLDWDIWPMAGGCEKLQDLLVAKVSRPRAVAFFNHLNSFTFSNVRYERLRWLLVTRSRIGLYRSLS